MSEDHGSLDELADLDEGLLEPSRADELRAHLAGCATCRDDHRALRDVHDELSGLPPVPMPADVAARIDDALAEAAGPRSATVLPMGTPTARRPPPALAAVAASLVVLLAIGAVVVGHYRHNGSSANTAGSSAAAPNNALSLPQPSHYTTAVSTKTFTRTTIVTEVRSLVSVTAAGTTANGTVQSTTAPSAAEVPASIRRLYTSPAALLNCAAAVTGQTGAVPLAVEFARYTTPTAHHAPSVIFVFRGNDASHVNVYIANSDCPGNLPIREYLSEVPLS